MELVDLFPKTIGVAELKSLNAGIIEQAIDYIDLNSSGDMPGDGAYTREQQLLNKVMFREVKAEIIALCLEFAKAWSHIVDDIAICNSWGNVVSRGDSIRYHRHSNAYISGSFYLTEGSAFNILNDHSDNLFGFAPALRPGNNHRALQSFSINPKPGRIILFPSNLRHMVLPSDSPQKRYSIAFNAVPVGRIGAATSMLELRLPE